VLLNFCILTIFIETVIFNFLESNHLFKNQINQIIVSNGRILKANLS